MTVMLHALRSDISETLQNKISANYLWLGYYVAVHAVGSEGPRSSPFEPHIHHFAEADSKLWLR